MNGNPLLGQVLGGLFGQAMGRRGMGGGMGGRSSGNHTALFMMLLPLAMRWVQRNGGMGAVLEKFGQKGMRRQTQSWVSTGANEPIDEQSVEQVVGQDELRQMAQRLGVPEQEVAQGLAEIMPEMVDKMTPEGQLPPQADEVLDESTRELEKEIQDVEYRETGRS
jgi:uncharacterized protein YidB (DUF937 family)